MTLVSYKPQAKRYNGSLFHSLLGDDFFGRDFLNTTPAVNVVESAEGYRLDVAAPGLKKENFSVNVDHKRLTISATVETKQEETQERYTRREYQVASFERHFTLPNSVDAETITAEYKDGILMVNIPKRDEAKEKPVRTIAIN